MCYLEGIYSPWGTARARTIPLTRNQDSFSNFSRSIILVVLATCADSVNSPLNLVWRLHHGQITPDCRGNKD